MSRAATRLTAVVACAWVLAFSPTPVAAATIPGVVGMLWIFEGCRKTRHAVGYAMLFGALAIGFGYRWLAATVRDFGDLESQVGRFAGPASWLVLAVYGIAATVHLVLFAILYRWMLRRPRRPHPLATVLLFVACETLPIRFLPWMAGYGAVDVAPLLQVAEWGGVALVSFVLLCLVVPLHEGLRWALPRPGEAPVRPRAALATFLVGALAYGAGWLRLESVVAADAAATTRLRVGIVQANIGSTAKRRAEQHGESDARRGREAYEAGTRRAAARGAELIVWPESALVEGFRLWDAGKGAFLPRATIDQVLSQRGYGFLAEVGKDRALLIGGYADEVDPPTTAGSPARKRFNVAALREAGGERWDLYRKVKLIPFGESMPGSGMFPALRKLLPQEFVMFAGEASQGPLRWKSRDLILCPFICYEAILPDLVATRCGGVRPDLLINLTNDSWFGDTWEPHQHLNFSRFRAVEQRAPLVRATNTGISALVSSSGAVVETLGCSTAGEIVADVPLVKRDRTTYARLAPFVHPAFWVLGLLALVVTRLRRSRGGARESLT